jgi:Flp pilus assembly pilin Flp
VKRILAELRADQRGAVMTEYVVLLGTMGLVIVASMLVVGPQLAADFLKTRNIITYPFP